MPELVLKRGAPVPRSRAAEVPDWVRQTVRLGALGRGDVPDPVGGGAGARDRADPGPDRHRRRSSRSRSSGREALADPGRDLAKIAVVERHLGTGRIGRGLVRGFGLERGALATTVSHDAHNLVVVGMSDAAMAAAARRLANIGGGIVAVDGADVLAELPLPVAGISERRAARRGGRALACRRGGGRTARLHARVAVPATGVPRPVGDPGAEDDRPRPRRRRARSSSSRWRYA